MKQLLNTIGALSLIGGVIAFVMSLDTQSAIHEIEAFILLLTFAVCMSGMGIIGAIEKLQPKPPAKPPAGPAT